MSRANADVETALDGISTLPDDAEDPVILRGSWSDRVTEVVISGPIGVTQLGLIADEFALRLFNAGVTKTSIQGIAAPQVVIEVPTAKLVAEDITMRQIANAIAEEVSADPAGDVSGSTCVCAQVLKNALPRISRALFFAQTGTDQNSPSAMLPCCVTRGSTDCAVFMWATIRRSHCVWIARPRGRHCHPRGGRRRGRETRTHLAAGHNN